MLDCPSLLCYKQLQLAHTVDVAASAAASWGMGREKHCLNMSLSLSAISTTFDTLHGPSSIPGNADMCRQVVTRNISTGRPCLTRHRHTVLMFLGASCLCQDWAECNNPVSFSCLCQPQFSPPQRMGSWFHSTSSNTSAGEALCDTPPGQAGCSASPSAKFEQRG